MIGALVATCVRHRWAVLLTTILLSLLGIRAWRALPVDAVPDITNVQVQVLTAAPGLSPLEVEVPAPTRAAAGAEQVLVVPAAALMEMKSAVIVFVKGREPGAFDVRAVEPGLRIGDHRVVHAGVADGEEVVVEGAVLRKGELMRGELGGD